MCDDDLPSRVARQSFPTPTVHGNYNRAGASPTSGDGLATFVSLFQTPTCQDANQAGSANARHLTLHRYIVKLYPTPAARDYRSPNAKPYADRGGGKKGEQLPNFVGGQLNPDWVCWLMGWPTGWTRLEPLTAIRPHDWSIEPPDVPRVATGIPARADRLKAMGNGQVPQCAAEAWTQLHKRLTEGR